MAGSEAKRLLGMVEAGADPAADKLARKEAPTIADLAARFFAEHAQAKRKVSTAAEYRRLLDRIILPALGKRKVADVTRQDVAKLHHGLRSTPYQANRLLAVLGKMFNLAERWGLRPDGSNPCRHVEKFAERKRERMLFPAELARLGDALTSYEGSPFAVAAIKLLVFTGARLGEILHLEWSWVDFDRGEARLPDSKSGETLAPAASRPRSACRVATPGRQPACDHRAEGWGGIGEPRKAVARDSSRRRSRRYAPP